MVAVGFQPRNGRLHTLKRVIMMSVIFFRGRHGEHIYAPPAEPFHGRTRKPILRIVTNHRNDRAVRPADTRPVCAVKAGGLHIKVQMFHCFSLQITKPLDFHFTFPLTAAVRVPQGAGKSWPFPVFRTAISFACLISRCTASDPRFPESPTPWCVRPNSRRCQAGR